MKTNHQWTRIGTRTDGPPSTTTGAKMLLHFCPVGVTLSWEEAHPGARASRPHKSSRSFGHLLHRNQPAAAPCLCFGRAPAVPAGRAVGCNIAGKLSGNPRDSMRAGRPRSRGVLSRWCAGGYPAGDFSENRPAPFGKLPFVREPCPRRAVRIKPECNNQKSTIPSRPWHPVAVNLNALVALRRSSWPFVDNSFFFCFRQVGPPPPTTGRIIRAETTDHCDRIGTWRGSGS